MKYKYIIKCLLILILSIIVCLVPVNAFGENDTISDVDLYNAISINNEFSRIEISDEDGRIKIIDNQSGESIYSYPDGVDDDRSMKNAGRLRVKSALYITLFNKETEAETTLYSMPDSVNEGGFSAKRFENEYIAEYNFPVYGVTVPVHYTLDGKNLIVSVLTDELVESDTVFLMDISIHPCMYCGTMDDDGYLLVPDGSGSLIYFNNRKYSAASYKQKVYGTDLSVSQYSHVEDTNPVVMPMFGIGKADGMMIGIISAGAGDAFVEGSPGLGSVSYNCAYSSFRLLSRDLVAYPNDNRTDVYVYPESRNDTEMLQITYIFQNGNSPSYDDMAGMYREYLVEEFNLQKMESEDYSLYLDLYMSTIRKKSFLGISYDGVEKLGSFKEAEKTVSLLHDMEISTVVRLNNWSYETVWGKALKGIRTLLSIGSKRALKLLNNEINVNGRMYLNVNISEVYSNNPIAKYFDYAKNFKLDTIKFSEYNLATNFATQSYHYLLSTENVLKYSGKIGEKVADIGFQNISVTGLQNMYTDYSSEKACLTRTTEIYEQSLEQMESTGLNVAVDSGFEYSLGYASMIFGMPSKDSMFEVCDEAVPFYEIALHGYIPYTIEAINSSPDTQKAYLKTLETGSGLYFKFIFEDTENARYSRNSELYSGDIDAWMDSMLEKYNEYKEFMKDKNSMIIIGHEKIATDVYRTVYEDGSYVIVNYSDDIFTYDNLRVYSMSHVFGKEVD